MVDPSTIRAVRNFNPGNLNAGPSWQGLMPPAQMTPDQQAETRFAVFRDPRWGFRALGVVLLNYEKLYGINTVQGCITRWAPPSENNTAAYIADVAQACGVQADDNFDLTVQANLQSMAKAIATHECGGWFFTDYDLQVGVGMAETH